LDGKRLEKYKKNNLKKAKNLVFQLFGFVSIAHLLGEHEET